MVDLICKAFEQCSTENYQLKNRIIDVKIGSQVRNWLMRIKDKAMC